MIVQVNISSLLRAKHMCLETAIVQAECKLQLVLTCDVSLTCSVAEGTACSHRYCLLQHMSSLLQICI